MAFNFLPRELHYGDKGGDVLALERALKKAGVRRHKASRHFGRRARRNVKNFQRKNNIVADGVVGPKTSKRLEKYYDGYGKVLIRNYASKHKSAESPTEKLMKVAYYALSQKNHIHYQQYRPMLDMNPPSNVPNYMDCSQYFTWCYKSAGLPDPNGLGYNGLGYTGTLQDHGYLRIGGAKKGDAVFSFWPVSHVSISVGGGMVISHGREGCPCLEPEFSVTETRGYIR